MFYRIKENKLYDYADYKYESDCIETDLCTMDEYNTYPNKWIVGDVDEEIEVPDYDEEGNPIIIEYEDTETVIDYDEEGNPIGTHEITVIKHKQQTHTEIVTVQRLIPNPNYEEEQAERREEEFKADFFNIENYGWYRKQPKGYQSAVESLNTAFNAVTIMQKLPAKMLIFYQAPDFTKPEECTEEWLIEHQIFSEEMTAQEFGLFYVQFMTSWNNQEHVNEEENADKTDPE